MRDHSVDMLGHLALKLVCLFESLFHRALHKAILRISDGRLAVFVYLVLDFLLTLVAFADNIVGIVQSAHYLFHLLVVFQHLDG